jgi:hypothetical protein
MTPEAERLAQALLDHHRQVCRSKREETRGVDSCLIAYGDLCERAGLPEIKSTAGKFLREVAEWCHQNRWPPLNSLAVNHETRRPGRGYDRAPGCSLERWREDVARCVQFTGYPEVVG